MLALVALTRPGGAHTQVQDATPAPGAEVEGPIDAVEVAWLDPLLAPPEIVVSTPDGQPVPGLRPAELVAPDVARATFDALEEPGTYQVTYRFASLDGAPQEGAHTFRFAPADRRGIPIRSVTAATVGVVVLGLAVSALRARSRQTR